MQNDRKDPGGQKPGNAAGSKGTETSKKKPGAGAKKLKHDPYENIPEFGDEELDLLEDDVDRAGAHRQGKQKDIFSDEDPDEDYYL